MQAQGQSQPVATATLSGAQVQQQVQPTSGATVLALPRGRYSCKTTCPSCRQVEF